MFTPPQGERSPTGRNAQVSVLAADLVITGVIASEGTIELHGQIEGELAAAVLTLGQEGRIQGKVQAGQLDVRGKLEGQVASGSLTLRASAMMNADCQTARLVIETGAHVQGRFTRPGTKPAQPALPPVAEPAGPLDPVAAEPETEGTFEPKTE